jgi:hypothetical protein
MSKSQSPATPARPAPPADAPAAGQAFAHIEYQALVNLYTHTENTLLGQFNFYLTLLSAAIGVFVVLAQLNAANPALLLPSAVALLMFVALMGIVTQEAVVDKNIDLSRHLLALNALKRRLLHDAPELQTGLFYMNNLFGDAAPPQAGKPDWIERAHRRGGWLLPLGPQQLFVGLINSIALSLLVVVAAYALAGAVVAPDRAIVGAIIALPVFLQVHSIYARFKYRRGMRTLVTAAGQPVIWS